MLGKTLDSVDSLSEYSHNLESILTSKKADCPSLPMFAIIWCVCLLKLIVTARISCWNVFSNLVDINRLAYSCVLSLCHLTASVHGHSQAKC